MELALSSTTDGPSRARVRPGAAIIAGRLRWLWIGGLAVAWAGTALFSLGMIGYCRSLGMKFIDGQPAHPTTSWLLLLVPVGIGVFLFGAGLATGALLAELAVRAWLRQLKQLLLVAAVVGFLAVALTVLVQPRLSIRGLTPNRTTRSLSFDGAIEFELPPVLLTCWPSGMRIGESSMKGPTSWDALALLGLPAALLVVPWAFYGHVRPHEDVAPHCDATPDRRSAGRRVARRLWRLLALAALVLPAALALEVMWLSVFVYRAQLAPDAARLLATAALGWAGSLVSLSMGAILAAFVGLYLSHSVRFGLRSIALATAALAVCFGILHYVLADWLEFENGSVWLVAHYVRPPEIYIQAGMNSTTLVRLLVIEPFSWFGPHSLLLVALPFLALPILWKWPTSIPSAERPAKIS